MNAIKTLALLIAVMFMAGSALAGMHKAGMMKHHMGQGMGEQMSGDDNRKVLNVSPMMKEHQKKNMREHLRAVEEIAALIGKSDFEAASTIAREKLGLNEEMKKMCGMFGEDFLQMGIAFHDSADRLSEVLKTKDINKSVATLGEMLGHCVNCHDTFRH